MSAPNGAAFDHRPAGSDDCRDFMVAFAEPLGRLAHLLTVGSQRQSMDADRLAVDALAQVGRHWREATESGFPELFAIDALLSKLARRHLLQRRDRRPVPWTAEPFASADAVGTGDGVARDIDLELVRAGLWQAFQHLTPRQRVPLVFADPSVASPRLAGLDVPLSFLSERRQRELFDLTLAHMRAALRSTRATASAADLLTDDELLAALADALRQHASDAPAPTDPYSAILERARQLRLRTGSTAAAVAVVLAVGAVGVVRVSTPPKVRTSASVAAAAAASASASASPQPVPQPLQPVPPGAISNDRPVVDWPVRGNAAGDAVLIAQVKADFLVSHPDAVGAVQVLLAQDTPAFRVAYLTANSPKGVLQSWFYGAPGSDNLVEGASSYGGSLVANATVLASALVDTGNQTELVVMAPPATTDMQLADFDFRTPAPADAGIHPLAFQDGVATKPIDSGSTDGLVLDVKVGAAAFTMPQLPTVALGGALIRAGSSSAPAVQRGQADKVLLLKALQVASVWQQQGTTAPVGSPVVLWGGTDAAGTRLVVVRADTQTFGLIVLEWSGDLPTVHGELLINRATPEVPVAFTYRGIDGIRVGVVAPPGVTKATLVYNGKKTVTAVDATEFASFRAGASPGSVAAASDVDPDSAGGLDIAGAVSLADAAGHVVAVVPFPPQP